MSEIIQDADGNDVTVFVRSTGGMVDAICRADTQAAWETAALSQGLRITKQTFRTDILEPAVYAEDTGELISAAVTEDVLTDGWTEYAPGAHVDPLGPVVLTAAVFGGDGEVITPAVMDSRYHVNLRITEPMLSNRNTAGIPKWMVTAMNWTAYGQAVAGNAAETGLHLGGVTLIDPDTINSPSRVWL